MSGSLQPAFDAMPGLEEIMPKEYGGKAPPYNEVFGRFQDVRPLSNACGLRAQARNS